MPTLAQLEKLLAVDPNDPFVLYALAQEYAKQGKTPLAVEFYDRCLAADPTYCYAYFHKARAQQAAGDLASAMLSAKAGIEASRKAGDGQALREISGLLAELEAEA